jgi:LmbE family N-acetylglucosaminyl deacetylase
LAKQRRAEQNRAAAVLGVASVTFLGYPDAGFDASLELRLAIARVIRQVRPEVVLTFDPQRYYHSMGINHPDHLIVGASTLAAVMPLANTRLAAPGLLAEGLEPHDVARVYLFETSTATHWRALNEAESARKLAALQAHTSQLEGWDGVAASQAHMEQLGHAAYAYGIHCTQAEAFTCVQLIASARAATTHNLARTRPREANLYAEAS